MQLAQACHRRTAVGLARSEAADLSWFLSVPLPESVTTGDILELLGDILARLRLTENVPPCTTTLTDSALEDITHSYDHTLDTDISFSFHRESHHLRSIPGPSLNTETIVENCLLALLSHPGEAHVVDDGYIASGESK